MKRFFATLCILAFPFFGIASHNININTAGSAELQELNGIGPAYAQNIIDYRDVNGDFSHISEIQNVSGIGPATYDKIKDHITVSGGGVTPSSDDPEPEEDEEEEQESSGSTIQTYKLGGEVLTVKASANKKVAAVHTPVIFTGDAYYGDRSSATARRMWNFGNGDTDIGKEVTYMFDYPGTYVITFSADMFDQSTYTTFSIDIVDSNIDITSVVPGTSGYIEIKNNSSQQHDLSRWQVISGGNAFLLPRNTFIGPHAKLRFTAETLNFPIANYSNILKYSDGTIAAVYQAAPPQRTYTPPAQKVTHTVAQPEKTVEIATTTLASVGATSSSDSMMLWLILLVGVITIGSITVLLIGRSQKEEEYA